MATAVVGVVVLVVASFMAWRRFVTESQGAGTSDNPRAQWTEPPEEFARRVIAMGLAAPWEIVWGPDGFLWLTERVGKRVVRVNAATGTSVVALTIEDAHQSVSQDGLLGMALHPRLLQGSGEDFVYVTYTYDVDPGQNLERRARVRRYTYDAATQRLVRPIDILSDLPHGSDHGGGRLLIGPDLRLYLSRGDHGANYAGNYCLPNRAQDLPTADELAARDWSTYQGKVLRIELDGSVPSDNPVLNGVRSHVYSYGHRNPQGMIFLPDGRLYASEHGEGTDDEVNWIRAGHNYGWPFIAGFRDDQSYVYSNWSASTPTPCASLTFDRRVPPSVPRTRESDAAVTDFTPPEKTFFTVPDSFDRAVLGNASVAPAGVDFYVSDAIPGWRDSLLMATMISGVVLRMPLSNGAPAAPPFAYFKERNRYRDLAIAPDGRRIYVVTDLRGRTVGASGPLTAELENPGAILEFTYMGATAHASADVVASGDGQAP